VDLAARLQGPGLAHPFGTDEVGRDLLRRWWLGGARSLTLAAALTALHLALGLLLALGAHGTAPLRRVLLALADLLASVPATLLALLLLALLRPGIGSLVVALALGGWIPYARLALNRLDVLRGDPSLLQARLMGGGPLHRLLHHVLPRLAPLLLAQATVGLGAVILVEGGLSFLGVGLPPDLASWGTMLASGRAFLLASPWTLLWPSLGILMALLAAGAWRGGAGEPGT
jgi:peptide/nickel transport system permease protein